MKKYLIILLLGVSCNSRMAAQELQAGDELREILRLGEQYRTIPYLTFNLVIELRDTIPTGQPAITMLTTYRLSQGRFHVVVDSLELMQGHNYQLSIYHDLKQIIVSKPADPTSFMMQVPLLDSLFQTNIISSMTATQYQDSLRKISIAYANGAYVYQIFYKKTNYLIDSLKYSFQNPDPLFPGDTTRWLAVTLKSYNTSVIDENVFMEGKYIYSDGTQFFLKPEYSSYELMVNGDFNNPVNQ